MIRRFVWVLSAGLLLAIGGCELFNEEDPALGVGSGEEPLLLYVANQDDASVTVIDMNRNEVVRTVDLTAYGFSGNARPHQVAVEPNGSAWYVSLIGESRVAKFTREDELVGSVETETPGMLLLHPTERLLIAGRSMSAVSPPASVALIDPDALTLTEEVGVFFGRPHALALSPDGRFLYTASLAENQLIIVDLQSRTVADFERVRGMPQAFVQFAVRPDVPELYVTGQLSDQLLRFGIGADTSELDSLEAIDVGEDPWHPVFVPDGQALYVPNKASNTVSVLAVPTGEVTTIADAAFARPHGSAVRPDGRYVYVSSNGSAGADGSVAVIDTRSNEVVASLPAGANAAGMGAQQEAVR